MDLKEVFLIAHKTGEFPVVEYTGDPMKHHVNRVGRITQIKPSGVAVDLGAGWDKWFHSEEGTDKRSKYMSDLKPYMND